MRALATAGFCRAASSASMMDSVEDSRELGTLKDRTAENSVGESDIGTKVTDDSRDEGTPAAVARMFATVVEGGTGSPVVAFLAKVTAMVTRAVHLLTPPHTPQESTVAGGLQHRPEGGSATGQHTPRASTTTPLPPHRPHASTLAGLVQHRPWLSC